MATTTSARASELQRQYLAANPIDVKPPEPRKVYGEETIYIYIRPNIFHKDPWPKKFTLPMEMINQVKYGKNTYFFGK